MDLQNDRLWSAAMDGRLEEIKDLIVSGAEVNSTSMVSKREWSLSENLNKNFHLKALINVNQIYKIETLMYTYIVYLCTCMKS